MQYFANNRNIMIKKVNKDSTAVVWDCDDYIAEAEEKV